LERLQLLGDDVLIYQAGNFREGVSLRFKGKEEHSKQLGKGRVVKQFGLAGLQKDF